MLFRSDALWLERRLDEIESALAGGRDDEALDLYFDAAKAPVRDGAAGPRRVEG